MSVYLSVVATPYAVDELPEKILASTHARANDGAPNERVGLLGHATFQFEFLELDRRHPAQGRYFPADTWDDFFHSTLEKELETHGVKAVKENCRIAPVYGSTGWLNVVVQAAPAVTGALGAVLGAWLQQRGNRKVRLKFGDREVEASTLEEIRELLAIVAQSEAQARQDDKRARIEALAHELWKDRGCPSGSPEVDWVQAEELIRRFGR